MAAGKFFAGDMNFLVLRNFAFAPLYVHSYESGFNGPKTDMQISLVYQQAHNRYVAPLLKDTFVVSRKLNCNQRSKWEAKICAGANVLNVAIFKVTTDYLDDENEHK